MRKDGMPPATFADASWPPPPRCQLRRREKDAQSGTSSIGKPAIWRKAESHLRAPPWRK